VTASLTLERFQPYLARTIAGMIESWRQLTSDVLLDSTVLRLSPCVPLRTLALHHSTIQPLTLLSPLKETKMHRATLSVVVLLLASIAGFASTTRPCTANCTTTVGTFTYLGNDSNGVSNWTVNVQTPVFFSTPITLNTATFFVKGTTVTAGPFISIPNCATGPFIPNNSCLLVESNPAGLAACNNDCISVAFQFLAGNGNTFTVKSKETGHLLHYFGTVNVFIIPTFGHKAIQPQDKAPIFMQIRSITYP
jgi:hypothetical protein